MLKQLTLFAAVAAATIALAAPAGAAKGGAGGSTSPSTIRLVVLTGGDSVPNHGEDVTFDVATTATTTPYVDLLCSQSGTVVYSATTGYFAQYPWPWTQTMTLSSQLWSSGPAACTATLYMFNNRGRKATLATLPFAVAA